MNLWFDSQGRLERITRKERSSGCVPLTAKLKSLLDRPSTRNIVKLVDGQLTRDAPNLLPEAPLLGGWRQLIPAHHRSPDVLEDVSKVFSVNPRVPWILDTKGVPVVETNSKWRGYYTTRHTRDDVLNYDHQQWQLRDREALEDIQQHDWSVWQHNDHLVILMSSGVAGALEDHDIIRMADVDHASNVVLDAWQIQAWQIRYRRHYAQPRVIQGSRVLIACNNNWVDIRIRTI